MNGIINKRIASNKKKKEKKIFLMNLFAYGEISMSAKITVLYLKGQIQGKKLKPGPTNSIAWIQLEFHRGESPMDRDWLKEKARIQPNKKRLEKRK